MLSFSLKSPCIIYFILSLLTHRKCKRMNAPEDAMRFQHGMASLLAAGSRSERQGNETYKSPSKRSLRPLVRLQQAGHGGGHSSSSQHICLHLCLSEEKLNYLTLENKGEKKRACQYQPTQTGTKNQRGNFCPHVMKAMKTFAFQPSPGAGMAAALASEGL